MNQKPYLPLTDEELAKSLAAKRRLTEPDFTCSPEDYALAEFGTYFGWQAVRDVLDNKINNKNFQKMLNGGRKVWYSHVYDLSIGASAAFTAPQTKHPGQSFTSAMNYYIKNMKVDS